MIVSELLTEEWKIYARALLKFTLCIYVTVARDYAAETNYSEHTSAPTTR